MFTPPSASLLALLLLCSSPSSLASPLAQRWVVGAVSDGSASSAVGAERAGAGGGLILVGEGAEQNGGLGLELGQSPGWVGWLSGWGWGEGEVTILHPNTSSSELTFPSRAASFTPRLSSPTQDPTEPDNSTSTSLNPLVGLLLPVHLFPNSSAQVHQTNVSGCPPATRHSSPSKQRQHQLTAAFGETRSGGIRARQAAGKLPLIALAVRGDCHFSEKVRWAQALGADAVIVGDQAASDDETDEVGRTRTGLITMFSPDDTSDLRIPAVFVSRSTYLSLRDEIELSTRPSPGGIEVRLYEDLGWEWPLLDLLLLLLLLPSLLTLATLSLHHFRLAHKRRQDRAHPSVVDALQTRIWTTEGWEKEEDSTDDDCSTADQGGVDDPASDDPPQAEDESAVASGSTSRPPHPPPAPSTSTSVTNPNPKKKKTPISSRPREYYAIEECAICLSEFEAGEVVRILPCGHVFHKDEIDAWLKGWKKLCPTCKADITVPPPHRHPVKPRGGQAATATATETTPLLAGSTTSQAGAGEEEDGDVEAEAGR